MPTEIETTGLLFVFKNHFVLLIMLSLHIVYVQQFKIHCIILGQIQITSTEAFLFFIFNVLTVMLSTAFKTEPNYLVNISVQ